MEQRIEMDLTDSYGPRATVFLTPKKQIRIVGARSGRYYTNGQDRTHDITFKVGDTAEWGSYNLTYTGTITKITGKRVFIRKYDNAPQKSFTIEGFVQTNWDFDLKEIQKRNSQWMD